VCRNTSYILEYYIEVILCTTEPGGVHCVLHSGMCGKRESDPTDEQASGNIAYRTPGLRVLALVRGQGSGFLHTNGRSGTDVNPVTVSECIHGHDVFVVHFVVFGDYYRTVQVLTHFVQAPSKNDLRVEPVASQT
jgi:hypothetical protein